MIGLHDVSINMDSIKDTQKNSKLNEGRSSPEQGSPIKESPMSSIVNNKNSYMDTEPESVEVQKA